MLCVLEGDLTGSVLCESFVVLSVGVTHVLFAPNLTLAMEYPAPLDCPRFLNSSRDLHEALSQLLASAVTSAAPVDERPAEEEDLSDKAPPSRAMVCAKSSLDADEAPQEKADEALEQETKVASPMRRAVSQPGKTKIHVRSEQPSSNRHQRCVVAPASDESAPPPPAKTQRNVRSERKSSNGDHRPVIAPISDERASLSPAKPVPQVSRAAVSAPLEAPFALTAGPAPALEPQLLDVSSRAPVVAPVARPVPPAVGPPPKPPPPMMPTSRAPVSEAPYEPIVAPQDQVERLAAAEEGVLARVESPPAEMKDQSQDSSVGDDPQDRGPVGIGSRLVKAMSHAKEAVSNLVRRKKPARRTPSGGSGGVEAVDDIPSPPAAIANVQPMDIALESKQEEALVQSNYEPMIAGADNVKPDLLRRSRVLEQHAEEKQPDESPATLGKDLSAYASVIEEHYSSMHPTIDDVLFDAYAPATAPLNHDFRVNIAAYLPSKKDEMHAVASEFGTLQNKGTSESVPIARGTPVTVEMRPERSLDPKVMVVSNAALEQTWEGELLMFQYNLRACVEGRVSCDAIVFIEEVPVARICIAIEASATGSTTVTDSLLEIAASETKRYQRVWCCFDPADELEFLRYKFCMQAVNKGALVFQRPPALGWDMCAVFWSRSSAASESVGRDITDALSNVREGATAALMVLVLDGSEVPSQLQQYVQSQSTFMKRVSLDEGDPGGSDEVGSLMRLPSLAGKSNVGLDSRVRLGERIGSGCFGEAFIATSLESDNAKIVVKKIDLSVLTSEAAEAVILEALVMERVSGHPSVVTFLGACLVGRHLWLLSEFVGLGDLENLMQLRSLSEKEKLRIAADVAAGVAHLHHFHVVHRDLAARNVLVTDSLRGKVADFGMSKMLDSRGGEIIHTTKAPVKWMAPESICGFEFSPKSDIWSFGVTVVELWSETDPYPQLSNREVCQRMLSGDVVHPEIPVGMPEGLARIAARCFDPDPKRRPMSAALSYELESLASQATV